MAGPAGYPLVRMVVAATEQAAATAGEHLWRVFALQDYNTRVVLFGTLLLGVSAGVVGVFMVLRKRALVGDVVGHASLPGIAAAFLVMEMIESGSGRSLPGLLKGAFIAGLLGALCTIGIRRATRIKEDGALAIVLSIFFGVGVTLFTVIQNLPTGNVAGLHHFVFGKTASLTAADVMLFAQAAVVVLVLFGLFFKELAIVCFDEEYAAAQGWPVFWLDAVLMGLVVGVTVIGLQSVGLLLIVALPIIPASAARFWTDRLGVMTVLAAVIGGLSGFFGVLISALVPRVPTGPMIVLVGSMIFGFSMLFGARRGVVRRWWIRRGMRHRVARGDLLRAAYEALEPHILVEGRPDPALLADQSIDFQQLVDARGWTGRELARIVEAAERDGLVHRDASRRIRFTELGAAEAWRAVRNHRMWELFLIHYAEMAPSHVDRIADQIEHVLEAELIDELESLMAAEELQSAMPESPHPIEQQTVERSAT